MRTVATPVTCVLKPGTQAFIDVLTAAETQAVCGAITQSDVALRPALPKSRPWPHC
jgi:hypothetical protein